MFYIPIQKDFSQVRNKVAFGLTKRQLICFGCAALFGIPSYLLLKGVMPTDVAAVVMIMIMLPFFLFALYEKDGQPLEVVLKNVINETYIRPQIRPVKNEPIIEGCIITSLYIEEQERLQKEVILFLLKCFVSMPRQCIRPRRREKERQRAQLRVFLLSL